MIFSEDSSPIHWSVIYWSVSLFVNLIIFKLSEWLSLGCFRFHRLPNMPKRREFFPGVSHWSFSLEFLTEVLYWSFSLRFFTEVLYWGSLLKFLIGVRLTENTSEEIFSNHRVEILLEKVFSTSLFTILFAVHRIPGHHNWATGQHDFIGYPSRCTLHQDYQVPND